MLAVVLSGGANYGAMQAGALEALAEAGLRPHLAVGTSAGALNAIQFAADPSPEGARRLQLIWQQVDQSLVGSVSLLGGLQRLVTNQPSLFSNSALADFVKANLPSGISAFGELPELAGVRAFTLATCLDTGTEVVFGDRDDDRLLDGAMASSGLPPFLPPWIVAGRRYIDGAVFSNLPMRVAIERGATQVLALEIHHAETSSRLSKNMLDITTSAVSLMVESMSNAELRWARRQGVDLRLVQLQPPEDVAFWDYAQPGRLIEAGRRQMAAELAHTPLRAQAEWRAALRRIARRVLPIKD